MDEEVTVAVNEGVRVPVDDIDGVGDAVALAVDDAVLVSVETALAVGTDDAFGATVSDAVRVAVDDTIRVAVDDAVAVEDAICEAVGRAVSVGIADGVAEPTASVVNVAVGCTDGVVAASGVPVAVARVRLGVDVTVIDGEAVGVSAPLPVGEAVMAGELARDGDLSTPLVAEGVEVAVGERTGESDRVELTVGCAVAVETGTDGSRVALAVAPPEGASVDEAVRSAGAVVVASPGAVALLVAVGEGACAVGARVNVKVFSAVRVGVLVAVNVGTRV